MWAELSKVKRVRLFAKGKIGVWLEEERKRRKKKFNM